MARFLAFHVYPGLPRRQWCPCLAGYSQVHRLVLHYAARRFQIIGASVQLSHIKIGNPALRRICLRRIRQLLRTIAGIGIVVGGIPLATSSIYDAECRFGQIRVVIRLGDVYILNWPSRGPSFAMYRHSMAMPLGRGLIALRDSPDPPYPYRVDWREDVGVRLSLLAITGACMMTWSLVSRIRVNRVGHCRYCDYDLTGNESGRCPECGTVVTCERALQI